MNGQMATENIDNVISAFTEEQCARLTGVTKGQLRYWHRTGFFTPAIHTAEDRPPACRLYSFRDIVALRTLNVLRNQYNVPLQYLRKSADVLSALPGDLWIGTTIYVLNKKVIFHEPGTDLPREVVSGQYVLGIPLEKIVGDTERDIKTLTVREPSKIGQIARSRHINHNTWVVAGTRIPTAAIRHFSEAGFTADQIMAEYPDLTLHDIKAALDHEQKLQRII